MTIWVSFFEIYGGGNCVLVTVLRACDCGISGGTRAHYWTGKLFDLLDNRKKLAAREDANKVVNVVGLRYACHRTALWFDRSCVSLCREELCTNLEDLLQWMARGNSSRSTGSTGANMDSSRSHAILQILLKTPAGRKKSQVERELGYRDRQPQANNPCPESEGARQAVLYRPRR